MPAPEPTIGGAPRTDAELSEFLMRACHDLRGPLRTVRIHAELLARKGGAESDESRAFVTNGAATAGAVLDGIADYALALAIDRSRFRATPLDVIVRTAIAKLSAQIHEIEAEISYDDLPSVQGDADRLLQLFEYLVDHSLRGHGPNRLSIRISADRQDGAWLFAVRDNGAGLPAESLAKAFTPFTRLHGNQRPGPGLAVCRAIVERHGGLMWGESMPGSGCVFWFTLPGE